MSPLLWSEARRQVFCVAAASHAASARRHGPLVRGKGTIRSCSYTRKKAHRKERQGQEVPGMQNWIALGVEPYIAYDPLIALERRLLAPAGPVCLENDE